VRGELGLRAVAVAHFNIMCMGLAVGAARPFAAGETIDVAYAGPVIASQCVEKAKLAAAAMTDIQLYIAAGLPTVAVLVGILMNVSLFNSLSARLLALENKVDTKLDLVAGKLAELDSRLFRVEERLSIH